MSVSARSGSARPLCRRRLAAYRLMPKHALALFALSRRPAVRCSAPHTVWYSVLGTPSLVLLFFASLPVSFRLFVAISGGRSEARAQQRPAHSQCRAFASRLALSLSCLSCLFVVLFSCVKKTRRPPRPRDRCGVIRAVLYQPARRARSDCRLSGLSWPFEGSWRRTWFLIEHYPAAAFCPPRSQNLPTGSNSSFSVCVRRRTCTTTAAVKRR